MFIIHVFACSLAVDVYFRQQIFFKIAVVILYSYLFQAVVYSRTSDNSNSPVTQTKFPFPQLSLNLNEIDPDNSNFLLTQTVFRFPSEFELLGLYCSYFFFITVKTESSPKQFNYCAPAVPFPLLSVQYGKLY